MRSWRTDDVATLLVSLPFSAEVWARVDEFLSDNPEAYWERVLVNPYQAKGDVAAAVVKLLQNNRPFAAIDCLTRQVHAGQPIDCKMAVEALLAAVSSDEPVGGIGPYELTTVIKALQDDPQCDEKELARVEWVYLRFLNEHSEVSPKTLERWLASDPERFCEAIRLVFRSENEMSDDTNVSDEETAHAVQAYRLLHEWRTPPGLAATGEFSAEAFRQWMQAVERSAEDSGHRNAALEHAGTALIYCPADPEGLWMHRAVADVLNEQRMEELRRGYQIAVFNSRGAHWVDPEAKPELELAEKYRTRAEEIEDAGFHRVAVMLRSIADRYQREAEDIVERFRLRSAEGEEL